MKIKKLFNMKSLSLTALAFVLFLGFGGTSLAYDQITTQLDPGDRGINVTRLQTFFADNPSIYPEGLVTGYFGSLTKNAVNRFQGDNGLPQVGRVGPLTLEKINGLILNGGWNTDMYAPIMYQSTMNVGRDSASFSWSTNENATSKIFYSTSPVRMTEGDINSRGFGVVNGATANGSNALGLAQQATIYNLTPNTTYYYVLVSTDAAGNVSISNVNNTFRTSP